MVRKKEKTRRAAADLSVQAAAPQARAPLTWTLAIAALLITFAAFLPALENEFLDWDDDTNFTENLNYRGLGWTQIQWMFTSFHLGHYQPITWLTLGWDFVWGGWVFQPHPKFGEGMNPRAYHFTNNLLHAINAALVYLVALRVLGKAIEGNTRSRTAATHAAAFVAALLFGVHPMRVENVAWITERRDLVSALLLLLTMLGYLRAVGLDGSARWMWIGISLALYALSLMAKVAGVPLPVVLLALDWYPLRRFQSGSPHSTKSLLLEKLLFLAPALAFAQIATSGQGSHGWLFSFEFYPMESRIVQAFYGLFFYVWQTLAPITLMPLYELHVPLDTSQPRFALAIVAVIAAGLALLVLAYLRRAPAVIATAICYAAFLGPVLGFFQNGPQIVADRYSYLPSIGLMMLLAGGTAWWIGKQGKPGAARAAMALGGVVIILLATLTWRQCKVWRTTETLWAFSLKHDKTSALAHNGYGRVLYMYKGQPAEAAEYFRKAVEIDPRAKHYRQNMRNALRDSGQLQRVIDAWLDEARFGQFDFQFHYAAGTEALNRSQNALALEHLSVAVALNEKSPQAHTNLSIVLSRLNRLDESIDHSRRAIALDPKLPNPRFGLALALSRQGKTADAITELQALLAIEPSHREAANLLNQLGGKPK